MATTPEVVPPELERVDAALAELMESLTAADAAGHSAAAMSRIMERASSLIGFDVSAMLPQF